jgi:transcriptional regulator with XRE-family HTH domain
MTNLRDLLAFNMKEQRRILKLSQAKLAEKVDTSTHYIGMIELGRKFPSPEMLERIAAALEIDSPELFSTRLYPSKTSIPAQKLQDLIVSDIEKIISHRIREADLENQTAKTEQGYDGSKNGKTE